MRSEVKETSKSGHFSLVQPIEDTISKTFGSMFSIIMMTENPLLAAPTLIFVPAIFSTNKSMYIDTADLKDGADILSEPTENKQIPPRWKSYLKDIGMWCSSAEKGITYAYGIYVLTGSTPMAVIAGIFSHRGDLLGEARLWSLRREKSGEPNYHQTVGRVLDSTNCQCLPKSISDYVAIDPIVTEVYPFYRSGVHTLAAYTGFKALGLNGPTYALVSLFFGGAEYFYSAGFNQPIMKYALQESKQEAKGLSKGFIKLYNSRPAQALTAIFSGRLMIDLLGIFLPPLFLNQVGKAVGSGLMGAAAAQEMREQIPKFVKIIADKVFNHEVDFEISNPIYYSLIGVMTTVLFISGRQQVMAAKPRQLNGKEIGLQAVLNTEYGITPSNPDERPASRTYTLRSPLIDDEENQVEPSNPAPITDFTPYCKNVSTRFSGLWHTLRDWMSNRTNAPIRTVNDDHPSVSSGPQVMEL